MYVVTVIPISRGIPLDELSYFSASELPRGALANVPLKGRRIRAIVLSSVSAKEAKADIKSAEWSLKKLEQVQSRPFFSPEFIRAIETTSAYHAASMGATLFSVVPQALFSLPHDSETSQCSERTPNERDIYHEEIAFQDVDEERLAAYKSLIREMFAKGLSVFFILPSQQDIEHVYQSLERGIRDYTFVLHGGLSARELNKRWEKATNDAHPVLVIATAFFLSLPRHDIGAIILDKESSHAYKLSARPFIDLRHFVNAYAGEIRARVIYGDIFLRVETLARHEKGEIHALARPKFRLLSTAKHDVVDMRKTGEQPATGRVAIYSPELVDLIEEHREHGTHLFVLAVRKGYAPMTVCGDCGTVLDCVRCSAPMVLHEKKRGNDEEPERVFLCHRCGMERDSDVTCAHCGGWRMVPLGIGIEQAHEALKKRYPDMPVFRLDGDSVSTHKEALERTREFYETPGSVLLGTEMALPYLTEPIEYSAILSVNSLLTIPDFRITERIFRLLLSIRAKTERAMLLQTRDDPKDVFSLALSGNIAEFFRGEMEERKRFDYPPFSVFIKFTFEGKQEDGVAAMETVEHTFSDFHPVAFPAFIARTKGKYRMHALLSIPTEKWPDETIIARIKALPPEIVVRIDPESVI